MNLKYSVTKIHKSWTLMFNWFITILAMIIEIGLQFAPEIKAQIPSDYYLYFIIGITFINKALRMKTNSSLESK